jgi:hypothetical protein
MKNFMEQNSKVYFYMALDGQNIIDMRIAIPLENYIRLSETTKYCASAAAEVNLQSFQRARSPSSNKLISAAAEEANCTAPIQLRKAT